MSSEIARIIALAQGGHARSIARLLSIVENDRPGLAEVMGSLARILAAPGHVRARVVGLTGPPGVGKSTTTNALVQAWRQMGLRVAVLAVDPSSPFTGGALLGDRVRMVSHSGDDQVYVRSMASRGHLGGLSRATPQAIRVFDAAGFEVILVETVGVGQSEVDIARLADTTLVLLAPGMGDGVQAAKAGVLEIGDVFVVNKADRPGAGATERQLRYMIDLGAPPTGELYWQPPIVRTMAEQGTGVDVLVQQVDAHDRWMRAHGVLQQRQLARAADEVQQLALERLREAMGSPDAGLVHDFGAAVLAGECDPYVAAQQVLQTLLGEKRF